MQQPQLKTCPRCNTPKSLETDFSSYFSTEKNKRVYQSLCIECRRIVNNEKTKIYYKANQQERIDYAHSYRADPLNKEKLRTASKKRTQAQRDNLQDCYVVHNISTKYKMPAEEIRSVPGLIQIERTTINLKRKIQELCQTQ